MHFIRLFHVRDPIQGAGSLSGISRDRCERLAHRYRVVRMAQPCVRRLLETAGRSPMCFCTAQWPYLPACLDRMHSRRVFHSLPQSSTSFRRRSHALCPLCVPAPSLQSVVWLGPLACPCGASLSGRKSVRPSRVAVRATRFSNARVWRVAPRRSTHVGDVLCASRPCLPRGVPVPRAAHCCADHSVKRSGSKIWGDTVSTQPTTRAIYEPTRHIRG